MRSPKIAPAAVHATLARHILADGYDLVLDLEKSHGRRLHDVRGHGVAGELGPVDEQHAVALPGQQHRGG